MEMITLGGAICSIFGFLIGMFGLASFWKKRAIKSFQKQSQIKLKSGKLKQTQEQKIDIK